MALRFEDVAQDGRLLLECLPAAIGPAVWRRLLARDSLAVACREKSIVPILSRLVLEGTVGPFSPGADVKAETTYQIALSPDDRPMLDVWADLFAPIGRTYPSAPPILPALVPGAPRVLAGRVFAEHTFTKPHAPAGLRRVARSDLEEVLSASERQALDAGERRPRSPAPESLATLPPGAVLLEPALRLDPTLLTFGVMHTDSNMHVNSLVYLRLGEEAALRRFAELGRSGLQFARRIDIAYRRPCFAGQTVRVAQQAFVHDGRLGVVAIIVPHTAGASDEALMKAPPHAFAQITFEP